MNSNNEESSSSLSAPQALSVLDMLRQKLINFKTLYFHRARKIGLGSEVEDLTEKDVIALFIGIRLFWDTIEREDEHTLLVLVNSSGDDGESVRWEQRDAFLSMWRDSLPEDKTLFWRYVKFFLHCVQELEK